MLNNPTPKKTKNIETYEATSKIPNNEMVEKEIGQKTQDLKGKGKSLGSEENHKGREVNPKGEK